MIVLKTHVKIDKRCLKQDKVTFTHKTVLNFYIVYKIAQCPYYVGHDFALGNCLFGAAKLTKNVDPNKYSYSGYGNGFDVHRNVSLSNGDKFGKNTIILGVDNSCSSHGVNRKRDSLVIGEGPTYGLNDTVTTAEADYSINFSKQRKKFRV